MSDDTSKRGEAERSQVADDEPYGVDYFANKHNVRRAQAEALIRQIGNDRVKLVEAASRLKR